ncbi:MAG: hypothetical protein RBR77_04100 [Thauera sp.]|jgi:hypothetical protein|nr:hypothetical protein [Thauera sp.]
MNLSNYRYNRLGGIDADRELESGEIVPYTLTSEEIATLPEGTVVAPYVEPTAPVPEYVSRAQGKAALIQAGLWQAVVDAVSDIEGDTERLLAETALYDTTEWRRDSPFLIQMATSLGLSDEQLDGLFRLAKTIEL